MSVRARVSAGRLIIDEPVSLPEGTVIDLVAEDEGDDLDDEERAVLHHHLRLAAEQMARGEGRPAEDVIADLRAR